MDPRISFSFSNDNFVDGMNTMKHEGKKIYREAPVSSDFEFCVNNFAMISADEVFSQGKLVPLKNNNITNSSNKIMTLRDELLVSTDHLYDDVLPSLPKSSSSSFRWKEKLGFRRRNHSHSHSNNNKNDGFLQTSVSQQEGPTKDNLGLFYERGDQKMC